MRRSCVSSRSSKRQLNSGSGRNYLSKLGKYLRFPTVSTPAFPLDYHLTNLVSSSHFTILDDAESVTSKSDVSLYLDCPHGRVLKHALSAPTLRPYSPDVASTKCLSLISEDGESSLLTYSLRIRSLPTDSDERTCHCTAVKPNTKRCWFWDVLKGNKRPRSSSTFLCASPVPIQKFLNTKTTFVPTPPLSEIFPANVHDLQLTPVIPDETDMLDDMDVPLDPKSSYQKSLNKLSRTLGVPLHEFEPRESLRPDTRSRRMTLPCNTTSNGVPSDVLPSSRKSLLTLNAGELHSNLADDFYDDSAEIRPGYRTSVYSTHSPISPLIFGRPPTPVTTQLPPSTDDMELESHPSSPRPHVYTTLNRSRSITFAPLRPNFDRSVASIDSHDMVNWPESTHEEVCKARNFVVSHPEYVEEFRTWSRQWNQDTLHTDFTDALRNE